MTAPTIDLDDFIRRRWCYMHLWRELQTEVDSAQASADFARYAADEKRELLACLAERRAKRKAQ